MSTLHINVSGRPEISGTIPMPFTGATTYSCPLGTFAIAPQLTVGGSGSKPTISGSFSLSAVPESYETVTFSGTYILRGGRGSGGVTWTGSRPRGPEAGDDTWTSDTTTPEPKKHPKDKTKDQAKAKGGAY